MTTLGSGPKGAGDQGEGNSVDIGKEASHQEATFRPRSFSAISRERSRERLRSLS